MTITAPVTSDRDRLLRVYRTVRSTTVSLCEPLESEDMVIQTMPDVSPTKWHLAHVTWFFEILILEKHASGYSLFDERFPALFNSYYQSLGKPFSRNRRGMLSRPTVAQIIAYRQHVDEAMAQFLSGASEETIRKVSPTIEIGLNHEQQHQELLLMDIQHVLAQNPLRPVYAPTKRSTENAPTRSPKPTEWITYGGGVVQSGTNTPKFAYDNERPRHDVLLDSFEIASNPVTAGEYLEFVNDDGYRRPEFWLADGWDRIQDEEWLAPLYWEQMDGDWQSMTLCGTQPIDPHAPVCHVSYFEADAFATWKGCRLPSEQEWERASDGVAITGQFLESKKFRPEAVGRSGNEPSETDTGIQQLFGGVWEWTSSPYRPYPGYKPFEGALSEYNGKFMINQFVLRGGCCATPQAHMRATYRNFYYPHQRWMFAGFRLAR